MEKIIYTTTAAWLDQRPQTLIVHSSDGRYQEAFWEFTEQYLKLQCHDSLVVPGGPFTLRLVSLYPKAQWATKFFLEFLMKHHQVSRIVLVGHDGCAWYKSFTFGGRELNLLKGKQVEDLKTIAQTVRGIYTHVTVEAYLAKPEGGHVQFFVVD